MSRALVVPAATTWGGAARRARGMWVSGEKAHQVSVASRARPTVCAGARSRHVPTRSAKTPRSRITSMTCAIPQSEEQGSSPPGLPSVPYGTISSDDEASSFKASVSNPSSDASVDSENALPPSLPWQRDDIGPGLLPSVATACLGAFLFGYHSAVINAPLSQIADDLGFAGNNGAKGAVVSVLVAGGFLGGLGIGPLADSRGRRAALAATTIPLTIGTLISAGADSFTAMTLGRLITGVGVGASSQIVPLYLSEVSPPNLRGTVNGVRRVAYVMGCLLAFQAAVPLQKPITGNVTEDVVREQSIRAVTLEGTQAKRGSAELTRETKQNNGAVEVLKSEALTAPDVKVTVPPSATDAGDPVSLKDGNGEVIKTEVPVPVLKVATTDRTIDDAKTQTEFETTVAETPFASSAVSNWSGSVDEAKSASSSKTVSDLLKGKDGDSEKTTTSTLAEDDEKTDSTSVKRTSKTDLKSSTNAKDSVSSSPPAGWWRPLFFWAAAPAGLLAVSTVAGVAVESPVWLLGPEGCALESRRSLAKLLNLRGRAAVRWQESVSGVAVGRIAVGTKRKGRVLNTGDEGDVPDDDDDATDLSCEFESTAEPAVNSWSALFTDTRNKQPLTIGLGLCFLAAFSGSNTVIYFASSVLREAGLTDPGLLTTAVGVPNLLGGLVALVATDKWGRRPLLLLSFGGMCVSLAALAIASALTPGVATDTFCQLPITQIGSGYASTSPGEFSGLPCVTCDVLAAICSDLPPPTYDGGFGLATREPQRTVALIAIPAYTLLFSLGAGPVPWLLYNEVFPTRIRARATAVCTAINYAANTVVGASFLPLVSGIGTGGTYGLYAIFCGVGYVFVNAVVFETKGLRLEDIEGVMASGTGGWEVTAGTKKAEPEAEPEAEEERK